MKANSAITTIEFKSSPPLQGCLYQATSIQSDDEDEANDCAVVATSIAFDEDYKKIHAAFARAGRKRRHRTSRLITHIVWRLLRMRSFKCAVQISDPYQPNGSRYTVRTIGKAFPKGRFLVFVVGHIFALVDGVVEDWSRGRLFRVIDIWEVIDEE